MCQENTASYFTNIDGVWTVSQAILVIPTALGASNRMEAQGSSRAIAGPGAQILIMYSVFTYAKMAEPTPPKSYQHIFTIFISQDHIAKVIFKISANILYIQIHIILTYLPIKRHEND